MLRIYDCLVNEHDPGLVVLAALICVIGAAATMMGLARTRDDASKWFWAGLSGVTAAATIWSTHFVAMLAYSVEVDVNFNIFLTMASFALGATMIVAGFVLMAWRDQSVLITVFAGLMVGLGVIGLHYVGMAAVQFSGMRIVYAPSFVAASASLSVLLGVAMMIFGVRPRRQAIGGLLLVAMTVSLHFIGMAATTLEIDPYQLAFAVGIPRASFVIVVLFAVLGILTLAAGLSLADRRHSGRLAAEAERFRTLADGAFEGIVIHDDGDIRDFNPAFRTIFGIADDVRVTNLDLLIQPGALAEVIAEAGGPCELDLSRADGSLFQAEACWRALPMADGKMADLISIRDVTARKRAEARLSHLAMHEQVTDLPNRRLFLQLAEKHLAYAKRHGHHFSIHVLDLDGFKGVNETHGHKGGDRVLSAVGKRICENLRADDVVSCFGGDEFGIVETGTSQPTDAVTVAERLLDVIRRPIAIEGGEVLLGCSIGISVYPADGETVEELLRNADTALVRAKLEGKGGYRFFEPAMDAILIERRRMEQRLRDAIAAEALEIAYQPLVDSHTRALLGFEALLRWTDPELGPVSPDRFIPIAEESGLILPLGEFVLRRACREAASWPNGLRVAVNLSSVQFRGYELVETVRCALADSGLPGNRLDLEITESILIDNREMVLDILNQLKALHIGISMDDFGTGFSSLSYLQSFPFDKIKIDRVFVSDLHKDNRNCSIVEAVIAMGRSLSMRVVAEGVEEDEQAQILSSLSCDELQGYLISRPLLGDAVKAFIDEQTGVRDAKQYVA